MLFATVGLLPACSTKPREFTPTLTTTPTAQVAFDADLADCKTQVASGKKSFGTGTAVAAGSAIGVGAGLATGASAASGMGMMSGTAAAAGLATGFIVTAPIAVFVVSRSIRGHKERAIKAAMTDCLRSRGYEIAEWDRAPKHAAVAAAH